MVYLLADWGMGDSEICNRNYADKSSSRDLLRIDQQQQQHRDDYDEVDLHPLSNQVRDDKNVLAFRCKGGLAWQIKESKCFVCPKKVQIY